MDKVIYFDYSGAAVVILLVISVYIRRLTRGRLNRFFVGLLLLMLLTICADIFAIGFDNAGSGNIVGKMISHTMYLMLHSLMPPVYVTYLIALADASHVVLRKKIALFSLIAPYVVVLALGIINIPTGILFYLGPGDEYTRGKFFIALYLCTVVYVIFGVIVLVKYRKLFSRERFNGLASMYPLMLLAVVFQFFVPRYPVEMLANALSLVFICMVIQKPEELIDVNTNLLKNVTYYSDLGKAFATHKKINIVLFNITNFDSLYDMLGVDGSGRLTRVIADKMQQLDETNHFGAEIYYLEQGRYSFVVTGERKKSTDPVDIAKALKEEFIDGIDFEGYEVDLSVALCIVNCPKDATDINSIKTFSDELYNVPGSGEIIMAGDIIRQDRYEVTKHIDAIIERAFVNKSFEVYYQPIYSVKEGRFNSAEALLRLKDEKYGFVSPEIFIPAAEKNGSIHRIGAFVLNEVCNFIAGDDFERTGLDYIEVNLSVTQCMRSDMAEEIQSVMKKYEIPAKSINLEITETATSFSQSTLEENLLVLTAKGITFSLDDFGTGYSNMQRIASLPLHIVKLDKIFTKLEDNKNLEVILENSIKMIKDMNMKIVIEGIETKEMLDYFSNLGCDYIQGYYFSKPIPRNEFVDFLMKA